MDIQLHQCSFRYELENVSRLFFFTEGVRVVDEPNPERCIHAFEKRQDNGWLCAIRLAMDGQTREKQELVRTERADDPRCEYALTLLLYHLLIEATPVRPGWGILTGVRPAKLVGQIRSRGMDEAQTLAYLQSHYLVTPEKAALALETAERERQITENNRPEDCSLYISIPFCPSRCSYCSFVSQAVETENKLIDKYVELLCRELARVGEKLRLNGLRLLTVYFGGGTPGILSAEQLRLLTGCVADHFDLSALEEYTVEVGRPDTVLPEKLYALREANVDRISINPQTMNDEVLRHVGRRHTAQQTIDAYRLAREAGFPCINMDLIAGLPGDTLPSFENTLEQLIDLSPENITVHTLSLKRAATLQTEKYDRELLYANPAAEMMDYTLARIRKADYAPYYMYRQKNTLGNLENIGFSRNACWGRYNVYIMEETHTILAVGAGSVTKLVDRGRNRIRRVFDYKYPSEYVNGFDEMLRRKDEIDAFYQE